MQKETLTERVREIMADTFGLDENDIPENPSQATLSRWSSIIHMVLIVALEEHFDLTFSMDEMISMTSLDQIVEILSQKEAVGQPA